MVLFVTGMCAFSTVLMIFGTTWLNNIYYSQEIANRFTVAHNLFTIYLERVIDDIERSLKTTNSNKELTRELLTALASKTPRRKHFFKSFFAYADAANELEIDQWLLSFRSSENPDYQIFGAYEKGNVYSFSTERDASERDIMAVDVDSYGLMYLNDTILDEHTFQLPVDTTYTRRRIELLLSENTLYLDLTFPLTNQLFGEEKGKTEGFAYLGLVYGFFRCFRTFTEDWLQDIEKKTEVHLNMYLPDGRHGLGGLKSDLPQHILERSEMITYGVNNIDYIIAPYPIVFNNRTAGYLLVSLPSSFIDTKKRETATTLAFIGLLTLAAAVPTVLILVYYFVRPIVSLERTALRIAGGELNHSIETDRKDELGSLIRSFVHMQDSIRDKIEALNAEIATRRETEEQLRRAEEDYRQIFEDTAGGIFKTTKEGEIIIINPALVRMLGYTSSDELLGQIAAIGCLFVDPKDAQMFMDLLSSGKRVDDFEVNWRKKNGESMIALMNAHPGVSREGTFEFIEGSVQDITIRKEKERAEAANNAKSEFLANMSHELRTPLNAVLGFSEILERQLADPQHQHYLQRIHSGGKTLLSLINDVLDLSKIEAGKLELKYGAVSLVELAGEMELIFSHRIKEKGLKWNLDITSSLPSSLLLDELRVRQVLLNLLGNAVKFTESGSVSLRVFCHFPEDGSRSRVELNIEVADTGIGITLDQQARIFEAFEQQKGQQQQYGGTGLGLAIAKRIVEMMGGEIQVYSEVGKGSVFTVLLPEVEVAATEVLSRDRNAVLELERINFASATLLIADDIDYNRELLRGFLAPYRFNILEAENGEEVFEILDSQQPDLILLDMKMPVLDGYEAAQRLREHEVYKNIPVIAATASALKHDESRIRAVCDGYLRKPIGQNELIQEIKKFLPYSLKEVPELLEPLPDNPVTPDSFILSAKIFVELKGFAPQLQDALEVMEISELEEIIAEIRNIAEKHAFWPLLLWTKQAQRALGNFDAAEIEVSVRTLLTMLDEE